MSTTTTKPSNNGTTRRTLASQIDRLDDILDGLGDALNESIASAVQKAVEVAVCKAVQTVITEMLTNPEVQQKLKAVSEKPDNAHPTTKSLLAVVAGKANRVWGSVLSACSTGTTWIRKTAVGWWDKARQVPRKIANNCYVLRRYKGQLLSALGVGVITGVGAYYAGPWLASVASGVCGFFMTLTFQAFGWMRGVMEKLRLAAD